MTTSPDPMLQRRLRRLEVNSYWLLRLRWVAVAGQLATVCVASSLFTRSLPTAALLGVIAITAASNLVFAAWLRVDATQPPDNRVIRDAWVLAAVMGLDLFLLTALLYLSGGAANPFIIFFLVNLALSAVLLPARWSWGLTAVAGVAVLLLLFCHVPVPEFSVAVGRADWWRAVSLNTLAVAPAVIVCGGVTIYFITRITKELHDLQEQLHEAEVRQSRSERVEALATLAAGAGHELASPLSTIAVIASDLQRHLEGASIPPSVLEDVRLIRSEVAACRRVLDGMSASAGESSAEELLPITVRDLIQEAIGDMRQRDQLRVSLPDAVANQLLVVPKLAVTQAIRGTVRNGLDASRDSQSVDLEARILDGTFQLRIVDYGTGMTPQVLARASEPFFTTKETGKGMGLGLFLATNLFERLGGRLELDSHLGSGTTVTITLPLAAPGRS